jgi:hypothetical protein
MSAKPPNLPKIVLIGWVGVAPRLGKINKLINFTSPYPYLTLFGGSYTPDTETDLLAR